MPNATITTYLNDADFLKYLQNKDKINPEMREILKEKVNKLK